MSGNNSLIFGSDFTEALCELAIDLSLLPKLWSAPTDRQQVVGNVDN